MRVRGLIVALIFLTGLRASAQTQSVPINWLDASPPPAAAGVSWGVPWPSGAIKKDQTFTLKAADGTALPLQTWPMAYWPDGSMKWIGFATVAGPKTVGGLSLTPGAAATQPAAVVHVQETPVAIDVDTGWLQCHIPRHGRYLIDSMTVGGIVVARQARLECILQNGTESDPAHPAPRGRFFSDITKTTVEQSGPVRAVIKLEGMHQSDSGPRRWLPFYVRLYFYAGRTPVRMVHSFVFDGDQNADFIRGLAVVFNVPMREEVQNRHVRFGGEGTGLWGEPIEPLTGWNRGAQYPDGGNVYADQVAGRRIPDRAQFDATSRHFVDSVAVWNDFRLIQPNANGFTVEKRTGPESAWIAAGAGRRASGLVFAGDVSGGLAVAVKNFWQSYPASLEVANARSDSAELRVWLWSPDAPAMDLRHYDTHAHGLNETYEDVQPGLSTANGIARTSDLTLFPCDSVPARADMATQIQLASQPPVLVATPDYLHSAGAFGIWSLQDRSTPFKKRVEDFLDSEIAFYERAVDQYNWYGFWDFGDIMHSYDPVRHVWRYDTGGFAWDDDEQCTEIWLWYSFLRTGRPDIYRMAEAMTRQISEVDCYHQGPLAGLGSRHNVRHWGDGAKEIRISQAEYRRFYYYLSTDERVGDVMREMLASEQRVAEFDPMREVIPPTESDKQYPARIRAGPDWLALVGNWMTEWERTGDTRWRDRIFTGIDSINAMPYHFRTSTDLLWGFYPGIGKLVARENIVGGYNLVTNMGGPEVVFELNQFIDRADWMKIWLQYCRLSNAPANVFQRDMTTGTEGSDARYGGGGRLSAYVYFITKNPAYARRAIGVLNVGGGGGGGGGRGRGGGRGMQFTNFAHLDGPDTIKAIDEPVGLGGTVTNMVNQNSLQMIEVLELCKDQLPNDQIPREPPPAGP